MSGLLRRLRHSAAGEKCAAGERGAATVEILMAVITALVLTLFLFNALLMLYTRSVIQHAADAGARAGARAGGTEAACETLANRTIADLANIYTSGASVECSKGPLTTTAAITARLQPMFSAFGPDWSFTIRAASVTEPEPKP